jgi:RNA polymerase sigma factor (sigma-70 family)
MGTAGRRPGAKPDGPLSPDERAAVVAEWLGRKCPVALLRRLYPRWAAAARRVGLTGDELRSCCHYGLMRAARLFDPAKGFQFGTYAGRWIMTAVEDEVRDRARRGLVVRQGGSKRRGRHVVPPVGSLDVPLGDAGEPAAWLVADRRDEEAERERAEACERVRAAVAALPPAARAVATLRLAGGLSVEATAAAARQTVRRVGQVEAAVCRHLARALCGVAS